MAVGMQRQGMNAGHGLLWGFPQERQGRTYEFNIGYSEEFPRSPRYRSGRQLPAPWLWNDLGHSV